MRPLTIFSRRMLIGLVNAASLVRVPRAFSGHAALAAVLAIRAYRLCLSWWLGNQCLFQPTCSLRAIDHLVQHGWNEGIGQVQEHLARCRGNYTIRWTEGDEIELETADGKVVREREISFRIVAQYSILRKEIIDKNEQAKSS